MLRVLFLMLILLAGLIAGPYLAGKQGYVLILTDKHSIEMSITMLVVFFVVSLAVVYAIELIITRFLRLSNNTYNWFSTRKRRKAQRQTLEGLMRMNEGNYAKAEKLIGKNAKHSDDPVLNFLKAAEAAQNRGDDLGANKYLIKATEMAGTDNLAVELVRTRILLQQGKLPAARSAVDSLLVLAPKNSEVLKLAIPIYMQSKAFAALDDILYQIENNEIFTRAEFVKLEQAVIDGLLDEKLNEEGSEGLLTWWENQPRKRRNMQYAKVGLIRRLIDSNDQDPAYQLAIEALKKVEGEEAAELLAEISRLQVNDSSKLVKLLEKRANNTQHSNLIKCRANRALGYLYVRNNQFDKAKSVFDLILADKENVEAYDYSMAAYVAEQLNDLDSAKQIRQACLNCAMQTKADSEEKLTTEQDTDVQKLENKVAN